MIQASELFNLLMGCIGLVLYQTHLRQVRFPGRGLFRLAFYAMLMSFFCTVVEGYVWPEGMNLLEHIGYAASGMLFAGGCRRLSVENGETSAEVEDAL